ncbi:MAG TPA: tripartite tricarboxylate transporter substrate-binding protein [Burkholderiales bacterium]|nr:tripartite tricarboxylate transporter substrate-binding protein [Burkholderiales bacterium]
MIDNRPGADGIVGTKIGAAPADYTLTMGVSSAFGINPALYRKLPCGAIRDFAPITSSALTPAENTRSEFAAFIKSEIAKWARR